MPAERQGVVVKLEERWAVVSVVSSSVGQGPFEARVELDGRLTTLKLGSWVVLCRNEANIYRIDRECSELLPTQIRKDIVLLRSPIYFQAKGHEGYGQWVWAPMLGKVAAFCHDKYNPQQAYVALVARTASQYKAFIEYNWMLTKYIDEPGFNQSSNNLSKGIGNRSSGDGASDSSDSSFLLETSSNGNDINQRFTNEVRQQDVTDANTMSAVRVNDLNTVEIEIFHGVVAFLNNALVVVELKEGRLGFLAHNQCDGRAENLKVGDWIAVAGQRRAQTKQYDIVDLPSLIQAETRSRVQDNTVMLLSTVKMEGVSGNTFYGRSAVLGNVVGNVNLTKATNECMAWCTPRVGPNFDVYWEAVELSNPSTKALTEQGRKVRFSSEHKIHYIDHKDDDTGTADGAGRHDNSSSREQHNIISPNSPHLSIYEAITRVISNPAVRKTIKNYRPKELYSIDRAIGLQFW